MSSKPGTSDVPKNKAHRFDHIDGLRAFAVLLVVLMHAGYTWIPGDSGVTVFFGISGYIITHILLREREETGGFDANGFYLRRALKLAPPFLAVVGVPTLIYGMFQTVNAGAFLSQVFFSYNWVRIFDYAASEQVLPGTAVVWSLAVEEQFYILFALVWLLFVRTSWWRRGLLGLSVIAILGSTLIRTYLAVSDMSGHAIRGTDARLDGIAWGVLAAVLYFMWQRGQARWLSMFGKDSALFAALALFLGGMALRDGWIEPAFRPTIQAIAGLTVILYGMVPTDTLLKRLFYSCMAWRPIQAVGLASYSIYLVHHPLEKALAPLLRGLSMPAYVTVVSAAGVLAGIALYRWVEVPALALRKKLDARSSKRRRVMRSA